MLNREETSNVKILVGEGGDTLYLSKMNPVSKIVLVVGSESEREREREKEKERERERKRERERREREEM